MGNSSSFAFTFILKKEYKSEKNKILKKLKDGKIEYRLIAGGSFLRHEVKKYFDYSVLGNTNNANYLHDYGFFVGNHPKPLYKEINFLKKILS